MATIDLTPARVDFIFVRGDTWSVQFQFPDPSDPESMLDLTGSTWVAQIKESNASGSIEVDPEEAVLFTTWTVDTTDQADGVIYLKVEEDVTETADPAKTYWYDLEQTKDGDRVTPIQGKITVVADVTVTE